MRLQLIRYESVELTEQLMREKQKRREENGDDDDSDAAQSQELEEESATATAASEVQEELRGVLLEEQRTEEPQEGDVLCVLTKDSVLMQLQDTAQQQGMLVD